MDPSRYQRDLGRDTPRRSTTWVKWLGLGCGCLFLTAVLGIGGVAFLGLSMLQRSGAYQEALAQVQESSAAREALGEPIDKGWWATGSVETSGPSGEASIAFPVHGPRGRGKVYAEAIRSGGEWSFQRLEVEVAETGQRIDLRPEGSSPEIF